MCDTDAKVWDIDSKVCNNNGKCVIFMQMCNIDGNVCNNADKACNIDGKLPYWR